MNVLEDRIDRRASELTTLERTSPRSDLQIAVMKLAADEVCDKMSTAKGSAGEITICERAAETALARTDFAERTLVEHAMDTVKHARIVE